MNWIKIIFAKDIVIAGFISILLFTIANFLFVYYFPSVLKVLPANVTGSISPCYRTLFHHDQRALIAQILFSATVLARDRGMNF